MNILFFEICLNNFRERFCSVGGNDSATGQTTGPRRMQVAGAQKKKEVWPHNEEANLDQVQQKVCLSGELAATGGFLSASSLPDRCLPSTSKSSAQTVIKLSGIGLCWGSGGTPSWSYTSAGVIRLVLVFLRIVQVPESVAGFASLVAGAKFIRTSVGCHESPHRDIRSSQSHFSYSTRVLKSFS